MIPKITIDQIIYASRVEEVVGDFITLKRRGANLLGICPFHNEKSPSFIVSPAKGIYKCFGCGKSGNSVNFIMDHEQLTYPEALKYLANKYNIEVVEKEITPEERAQQNEKESLMIVNSFAQKFFSDYMWNTDEGKSIGLGYLKNRGFRDDIIQKFQLGFSPEIRNALCKAATDAAYKPDYLVKTGLGIVSNKHVEGQELRPELLFDRFSGRVMFPIHNVTGKVVGFTGRILTNDKKLAKYVNSPQSEVYDKSKVLYGLYFSKQAIQKEDFCFLVEGNTDVISLHQAGIENVVASSGTSLTLEQIKLIHRFTNNLTILYDGDNAGEKASDRAIDMLLQEGMNVRVLSFPDGDDPDSYAQKVNSDALKDFIKNNSFDFITYKTAKAFEKTKNDPIKKIALVKDIVESISVIPDSITRSVYIKECSRLMDVEEQTLNLEVNKLIRSKQGKKDASTRESINSEQTFTENLIEEEQTASIDKFEVQEKALIRILMQYGNYIVNVESQKEGEDIVYELSAAEYIIFELLHDQLTLTNPMFQLFIDEFIHRMREDKIPDEQFFLQHQNPAISQVAIDLATKNYLLSENWSKRFGINVAHESDNIKKSIEKELFAYKEKRLQDLITEQREKLKLPLSDDEAMDILIDLKRLDAMKARANKLLGRTVIK